MLEEEDRERIMAQIQARIEARFTPKE